MKVNVQWLMAISASVAMAACGGGSDSGAEAHAPETPASPVLADRIEPYDTGTASPAASAKAVGPLQRGTAPARIGTVLLGPLPEQAKPKRVGVQPGKPWQIGVARDVADTATVATTQRLLQWQPAAQGGQVAALAFATPDAKGVRLGVLVRALPEGAVLRFYGAPGDAAVEVSAQELQAAAARNAQGGAAYEVAHTYWSPDFAGPRTTLEVEIPASASPSDVLIAVPRISHFTHAPDEIEGVFSAKVGESGSCNVDVVCRPEFSSESRSVARMIFVDDDGEAYLCTGTLLNDMGSTGAPYFLSAHHCISTQATASSLTTDWFYRASACNGSEVNPGTVRLTGGALLLHAAAATDTSFMRLNSPPPAGVVYAGSYFGSSIEAGTSLVGVHHPQGDLQKVSVGTLQRYSICANEACQTSNSDRGTFLTLGWQQGMTEGGSSGSGLFLGLGVSGKRYVVGQLYGGSASCAQPTGVDHYGRFDEPYRSALRQWLNPGSAP